MAEDKKRFEYFDGLRVVCALLIILLHVLARPLAHGITSHPMVWEASNILSSFTRIGVVVFFMISGALLINSKKCSDTKYVLKNKVFDIFTKLLIVSIIYTLIHIFIMKDVDPSFLGFIRAFLEDDIDNRLWFLYTIMGLYLCLPILRLIVESNKRNLLWYIVFVALFANSFIYSFNKIFEVKIGFMAPMMMGYIAVFILGYLLNTTELNKKQRTIIYVLGVAGLLFRILITRELSFAKGELVLDFYNNLTFNVLATSIAFFVFAKYSANFKKFSMTKPVKMVSNISLGLYLVHPILVELFFFYTDWSGKKMGVYNIVFMFFVILIATFIIVIPLYKNKYTRKLIT